MPAVATITLPNGEATPVNHSFTPLGQDSKTGIWWFEDKNPRVPVTSAIGYPRIGIRIKREFEPASPGSSARNAVTRVEYTLALPQLETLGTSSSGFTPAPQVAYVDRSRHEFLLSSRDSEADRKDVLMYAFQLLGHSISTNTIVNLESLY